MHQEEMRFIQEAFDTNWVAPLGKNVDEFEKEVASYVGIGYTAALSSGTAALHLAIKLVGVQPGDIVLCSDMTFSATVNPVAYEKGIAVFIDSERDTWNMDPAALEKAFEKYDGVHLPKPKAVVLVNLYGTPAKLDEIIALCKRYQVPLIEDAAESLSSTYKGRQTGTFGLYSALSFNGNKIITTSGGGMLLSNDKAAIEKAHFWATQARDPAPWYQHSEIGYNYRMSNIVAGIGRGQLLHLDEHRDRKREIYQTYKMAFDGLPVLMTPYESCAEPNFWLSCLLLDYEVSTTPLELMQVLADENIESRPIWKPMHLQPVYARNDFIMAADEDVGTDIFERGLCLPSDIKMSTEEQEHVVYAISKIVAKNT